VAEVSEPLTVEQRESLQVIEEDEGKWFAELCPSEKKEIVSGELHKQNDFIQDLVEEVNVTSIEEQIETASNAFQHETGVQSYVRKTLFEMSKSIRHGRKSIASTRDLLNETCDLMDT